MGAKRMSQRDAEAGMWIAFEDFVIDGDLLSFTDHAGIDLQGGEGRTGLGQVQGPLYAGWPDRHGPLLERLLDLGVDRLPDCRTATGAQCQGWHISGLRRSSSAWSVATS